MRRAVGSARAWLAAEGDRRALAVTGPAGIGKSTLLAGLNSSLSSDEGVVVLAGSTDGAKSARHFADRARSAAKQAAPGAHLVLLLDDFDRLGPDDQAALLELSDSHPGIRAVVTAAYEGQLEDVVTLPVRPLGGSVGSGPASGTDRVQSSEVAQFFLHCLRHCDPTAELTRADTAAVARICASSFGIPSEVEALAGLVERHGLAAVDAAVGEDGPRQQLAELLGEPDADHLSLTADEMVVLASILTAPGGAATDMLQQSLPRCDISELTRSLIARGYAHGSAEPSADGLRDNPGRFHLRVTGLPAASWCAAQHEMPLTAIRQAQADYLSARTRRMAALVPTQAAVLAEFRHERRNLRCVVTELLGAGRYAQAVALMLDALPLLARGRGITELLPCILHVIREYAPTALADRRALHRLAVSVLWAAGEHEAAGVCFEQLLACRTADDPGPQEPDVALLGVLVAERMKTEEAVDILAGCVEGSVARRDLLRLCESATAYFAYLMRDGQFERVQSECRPLLFEATRSGDEYAAGLLLLWRAAAGASEAAGLRLHVERALAKLRPLGPEAVLSAITMLVGNRGLPDARPGIADLAAVVGALGQADWAWDHDRPMSLLVVPELAEQVAAQMDARAFERSSRAGEAMDLVDLLCHILTGRWTQQPADTGEDQSAGGVPDSGTVEPGRLQEHSALTPREAEVASLVATGLTNKQVGHRLSISEWTVINHLRHVMRKLGFASRVQVANWVRDIDRADPMGAGQAFGAAVGRLPGGA
ncbi:LuxR C-terminal-related transcriptional regulator [Streptomyces sp.]|jgi:DNA-binding CsgD family transcriptional regulator